MAIRQNFVEPPTLVTLATRTGAATKISTFNDTAMAALDFARYESVTYKGARDADIQMWVFYPPGFDAAKKYPVLMLLHGGPHNAVTDAVQWRWNAQVFASWGYVVTWHNFHGSSGFGNDFADSINPDWITLPYEDTIRAADWLMARPFVDRERMVAAGASYGGFLATTLLGRPHPFKALVAHAAVYNMFTQTASDYGADTARFFDFWERPEEFARYSPHTSAANFVTPTLDHSQPAGHARAGESRHRAVQHPAAARRAFEAACISRMRTTGCSSRRTRCSGTRPSATGLQPTRRPARIDRRESP